MSKYADDQRKLLLRHVDQVVRIEGVFDGTGQAKGSKIKVAIVQDTV